MFSRTAIVTTGEPFGDFARYVASVTCTVSARAGLAGEPGSSCCAADTSRSNLGDS